MEIYVFEEKIKDSLRRAILSAGGKEVSCGQHIQVLNPQRKSIKAFSLEERKKFPKYDDLKNILDSRIENFPFSTRALNILRTFFYGRGAIYVYQVVQIEEKDFLKMSGCGRKRQVEIRGVLRSLGLDCIDRLSEEERSRVEIIIDGRSQQ